MADFILNVQKKTKLVVCFRKNPGVDFLELILNNLIFVGFFVNPI